MAKHSAKAGAYWYRFQRQHDHLLSTIDKKDEKGAYNAQYVPAPEIVDKEGSRRWSF